MKYAEYQPVYYTLKNYILEKLSLSDILPLGDEIMNKQFSTFGQELYQADSIIAIERFHYIKNNDELLEAIIGILPHRSIKTRTRVAEKFIQRFFNFNDLSDASFLKMVRSSESIQDKIDLIYWRTARTDKIIAAIANEIFYSYFINNSIPGGYSQQQFDMKNTYTLFSLDKVITADFVVEYALSNWNFSSKKSILLALRIMRQANMINSLPIITGFKKNLGYYTIQHYINPKIFAFCLYEEFSANPHRKIISMDQIQESDSVKVFFISRLQLESIIKSLQKDRIIKLTNLHAVRYIEFTHEDASSLTSHLIKT